MIDVQSKYPGTSATITLSPSQSMLENLVDALDGGLEVVVEFEKADGTLRKMRCVSSPELAGIDYDYSENPGEHLTGSNQTRAVWDMDKNAWRSFRYDRVKKFTVETDQV